MQHYMMGHKGDIRKYNFTCSSHEPMCLDETHWWEMELYDNSPGKIFWLQSPQGGEECMCFEKRWDNASI